LSRVFTALNLLPSTAASAWVKRPSWRHSNTNCATSTAHGRPRRQPKRGIAIDAGGPPTMPIM
jgi:hypothetical protein